MGASFKNTEPIFCGYYSITSDREFDESDSSLRYFKKPKVPLDLNIGIDSTKMKPMSYIGEKMDSILTYIVRNKSNFVSNAPEIEYGDALISSTKYITYRGIIRKIMCSPYENRSGWCILATKYKNNIYLCQLTQPEDFDTYRNEYQRKFALYGPKFEQYCLTDDPFEMPDPSQPVDACSQFFCVFKRMLVGRKFLFAGEIDGIDSNVPVNLNESGKLNNLNFIELKVNADHSNSRCSYERFKRVNCRNVWAQNFLTGVKDVYFGMRNNVGIVKEIKHYPIEKLPKICQNYWNPMECFSFLNDFLKIVEDKTDKIDCPHTVFKFDFNERTKDLTCTEYTGKTELSLLPDWYLKSLQT